jgi:cob(I)alamin adenosyltransferase
VDASLLIFFVIVVAIPVLGGIGIAGFQRWLQHKERMGQLIAGQTAEKAAQYAAHVERIEARLRVVEEIVTDGGTQTAAQIEALRTPVRRVGSRKAAQVNDDMAG